MQEYLDIAYNFITHQLQTNQFFSAAALSSVLISMAYSLKSIPYRIWGRIHRLLHYSATMEQEDSSFRYIDRWIADHFQDDLRNVELSTNTINDKIVKSHQNDYMIVWRNWRRIRITKNKQKLEHASNYGPTFNRTYTFEGYGARKAIDKLLEEAITYSKSVMKSDLKKKKSISVYQAETGGTFEWITSRPGKIFDQIFITDKIKLIKDLEKFKENREKYKKLRIPFKRGYLFYGAPGNGKSSLAYAIADYLKYDIYSIDMSTMLNSDFLTTYNKVPDKSVIVIEDIDTVYNGRDNVSSDGKVNFSTFINALSGVGVREEIITVITTNNIAAIDPALMREGRCDFKFEITNPTKELAEQFLFLVFGQNIELDYFPSMPFVKLQEIAVRYIDDLDRCLYEIQNVEVQEPDQWAI